MPAKSATACRQIATVPAPAPNMVRVWQLLREDDGETTTVEEWPDGAIWAFFHGKEGQTSFSDWEQIEKIDRYKQRTFEDIPAPSPVPNLPKSIPGIGTVRAARLDHHRGIDPCVDALWAVEVTGLSGDVSLTALDGVLMWPPINELYYREEDGIPGYSCPDEMPWHVERMIKAITWRSAVYGETKVEPLPCA
jgi:hypothetical protein